MLLSFTPMPVTLAFQILKADWEIYWLIQVLSYLHLNVS